MCTGRLRACKPYNKLINLERSVITGKPQTSILPYCQLCIFAISNFSPSISAVLLSEKNKKKLFGGFVGLNRAGIILPFDKAFRDMDLSRLKEVCNDSLRAVGAD